MLSKRLRQKYLKDLGLYKGSINGKWDAASQEALMAAKRKFMQGERFKKRTIYDKGTDRMLVNAHRFLDNPYFSVTEYRCECGGAHCSGYPALIDEDLIANDIKLRKHFGAPMIITSGLRCRGYNNSLAGSINTSRHLTGRASDKYIQGITISEKGRKEAIDYWNKLKNHNFCYGWLPHSSNTYMKSAEWMGNAIHGDVD